MKRMLVLFMIFHYVGYFSALVLIFLLLIFLSPSFVSNLDYHWTIYYAYALPVLRLLLLFLIFFLGLLLDNLASKSIVHFLKRMRSIFHGNPQHDSMISSVVLDYIYNDPQQIISFRYPVWLYKSILRHKIITTEKELSFIKKAVSQKTKISKRFPFLFHLIAGSNFFLLYLLWDIFLDIPLDIRFILSLPIIITLFMLMLYFVDYPYRTLIKLAKKYNITEW